jgi:hypothetical protein
MDSAVATLDRSVIAGGPDGDIREARLAHEASAGTEESATATSMDVAIVDEASAPGTADGDTEGDATGEADGDSGTLYAETVAEAEEFDTDVGGGEISHVAGGEIVRVGGGDEHNEGDGRFDGCSEPSGGVVVLREPVKIVRRAKLFAM